MATATVERQFKAMQSHAEKIRNDERQRAGAMAPGDCWAQGDVGIVALMRLPNGCKPVENPSLQLASGTTQGSRHRLESLEGVKVYQLADPTPLDGPVIDAEAEFCVTHPEHGDCVFPPGVYAIVYQRADYAGELRRVQD